MKLVCDYILCLINFKRYLLRVLLTYFIISTAFRTFHHLINKSRKASEIVSQMLKALFKIQRRLSECHAFFSFFRLINSTCKMFPVLCSLGSWISVPYGLKSYIYFSFLNKIEFNFPSTYEKLYPILFGPSNFSPALCLVFTRTASPF